MVTQLQYLLPPRARESLKAHSSIEPSYLESFEKCSENLKSFGCSILDAKTILRAMYAVRRWGRDQQRIALAKREQKNSRRYERTVLSQGMRVVASRQYSIQFVEMYFDLILMSLVTKTHREKLCVDVVDAIDEFLTITGAIVGSTKSGKDARVSRRRLLQARFRRINASYPANQLQEAAKGIFNSFQHLFAETE